MLYESNASVVPPVVEIDGLVAQVVDACARVRRHTLAFKVSAEQRLREIREAGRLFALVQRSRGGRPKRNALAGLTDYARALSAAKVSRPTAISWQRVAAIPDVEFERYLAESTLRGIEPTIESLLAACGSKSPNPSAGRVVRLRVSDAEYEQFHRWVDVLAASQFRNPSETVLTLVERAYHEWLARQTDGSSATIP